MSTPLVQGDSHLTLHYRISLADGGGEVVSTFGGSPATLQLGLGQMAEPLERCLLGLAQGSDASFALPPGQAYGDRNPALIQRVARAVLEAHAEPGTEWSPGDLVDFSAPDGGRFAGVLKSIDERGALFDFNHPLAGRPILFEVRIIAVL
jgi:FKBP-type peptidyl-prolyl cis-trans isomerase SlpA